MATHKHRLLQSNHCFGSSTPRCWFFRPGLLPENHPVFKNSAARRKNYAQFKAVRPSIRLSARPLAHTPTRPWGWAGMEGRWRRMARAAGSPGSLTRSSNRPSTSADTPQALEEGLSHRTVAEWYDLFKAAGVPCGPVNNLEQALEEPQLLARDMIAEVEGANTWGGTKLVDSPIRISGYEKRRKWMDEPDEHGDRIRAKL